MLVGLPFVRNLDVASSNDSISISWHPPPTFAERVSYAVIVRDSRNQTITSYNTSEIHYDIISMSADIALCIVCTCTVGVTASTEIGTGSEVTKPIKRYVEMWCSIHKSIHLFLSMVSGHVVYVNESLTLLEFTGFEIVVVRSSIEDMMQHLNHECGPD